MQDSRSGTVTFVPPTYISAPERCGLSALRKKLGHDALAATVKAAQYANGWPSGRRENCEHVVMALPSPYFEKSHASVENRESLYASSRRGMSHI